MHIRKKNEMRSEKKYMIYIDGEELPMVNYYKYFGCVVDENLDLK